MPGQTQLDCPECGATLRLKVSAAEVAGKSVRCPQCQAKFTAPAAQATSTGARRQRAADPDDDELPEAPPSRKRTSPPAPPPLPTRKKKPKIADDAFDTRAGRRKGEERPLGTAFLLWTALGIVGALLGLVLWVSITYATHRGFGFLAIVVGCLVGVGVRLGAREHEGWMPGLTALFLALSTIFCGYVSVTYLLFDDSMPGVLGGMELSSDEEIIGEIAFREVMPEFQQAGKPFELTDEQFDKLPDDYTTKDEHLPAVWTEAEQRWKGLTPEQKAAKKQEILDARMGLDRDSMIANIIVKDVEKEFTAQGKPVYATDVTEYMGVASGYHPDAWAEGVKRWEALTPEQQAAAQASARQQYQQAEQAMQQVFTPFMFVFQLLVNFGLTGFVYCLIAGIVAYRVGSTSAIVG